MAQKVTITLVDDLDESVEDVQTVTFGLDGRTYEVDLAPENEGKLRDALAPYVNVARRVTGKKAATPARAASTGPSPAMIREWAVGQGMDIPPRGRIPQSIRDEYANAH